MLTKKVRAVTRGTKSSAVARSSVAKTATSSPPAPEQAKSGRRRDEKVHEAILRAAVDLLQAKGSGALSIEGIAAKAGVSKQSIYRRWGSTGEMLIDLYMDGMDVELPETLQELPFDRQLVALLEQTVRRLKIPAYVEILRGVSIDIQTNQESRRLYRERIFDPRMATARKIMERAVDKGELRRDIDVDLAVELLYSVFWFRIFFETPKFSKNFAASIVDVIKHRWCV